jgi:hypothetical protein
MNKNKTPIPQDSELAQAVRKLVPKGRGNGRNSGRILFQLTKEYKSISVMSIPQTHIGRDMKLQNRIRISLTKVTSTGQSILSKSVQPPSK